MVHNLKTRLLLSKLSIRQRLPLLICGLLLFTISIYGLLNYYSLRKAALAIGKVRISLLSNQIGTMLAQQAQAVRRTTRATAAQKSITGYLYTAHNDQYRADALSQMDKLHRDSTWVSVELLDTNKQTVLRSTKSTVHVPVPLSEVLLSTPVMPDSCQIGKFYNSNGTLYYPIIAGVSANGKLSGYLVSWQLLHATPQAVAQLSQLMGSGAHLYLGNADASIWTDMIKPVPGPPFGTGQKNELIEYIDKNDGKLYAKAQQVFHTPWLAVIAFPEKNILEGTQSLIPWILLFGVVLMVIGIIAARIVSRDITKPLNQLTEAARTMPEGEQLTIDIPGNDELGQLATAFNRMTSQIYTMWHDLEQKVQERTGQLERANKELDAFSYSVSHDLRTPLRAINGYAVMLQEDYGPQFDAEGNRIINNIVTNATRMGRLIDDLLAFSKLGKKDLVLTQVDMQELAHTVINELLQNENDKDYNIQIIGLPPAKADAGMIRQVLMNLISNAIKYSSKKEHPVIEIGGEENDTYTSYFVRDNGAGFDMAYADKLFGVFQRLHSQEEFEGTGVGLALVKRIIDKHHGTIRAEGQEGQGATFYFHLPKKHIYERQQSGDLIS
ncbi:MAG: HAMP domain-containing protein [Bacteroidetes bacterium]|jgi:signal transduction histidine kinase|nr:HAMP domain-containing protein [Bacteroidota bacterium]